MSQGGLNKSVSPTVDTVEDYVQAATAATAATKAYADAINGFASPILDAREANRQWEESIDSAAAALKENGKTLSDSTDKGPRERSGARRDDPCGDRQRWRDAGERREPGATPASHR